MRCLTFLFAFLLIPPTGTAQTATTAIRPFLDSYCTGCHNQTRRVGGIMLDVIRLDDVAQDAEVWEKVLRELRAHTMPMPFAAVRPDDKAYDDALSILVAALDTAAVRKVQPDQSKAISETELAARLARLLWNAPPDAQLLDAARRRTLRTAGELERQVQRMMKDSRVSGFI